MKTCINLLFKQDAAGFQRINSEGDVCDVPYVIHAKEKHLPVFYFDGDTGPLQDAAISIGGWEMTHLRVLYNVQGVREELINSPLSAKVAPLASVLQSFPSSATVEEYWPEKDFLPRSTMSGGVGGWTKLLLMLPPLAPVKEWPLPMTPCQGDASNTPYVLRRLSLLNFGHVDALNSKMSDDLTIHCIDLLVTLPDLASCLNLDLELVGQLLVKLKVTFYRPNSGQAALLESKGKDMVIKPVPLIKVKVLTEYELSLLDSFFLNGIR